ncbi:MAG: hypothetical protein M3439_05880 [Chloroflexota bacterium]|nr:hypothetical protein [Chloroflexota bacterium]
MARIASRMAHSALRPVLPVLLLALALLLASCTTPEIIRETPQPSSTETPTLTLVETEVVPTGTAAPAQPRRQIERIALATDIADNGAPEDERSAIPEAAENFYLCVQVRDVEQGSRFQAIWFEGGDIIGRSDKLALEDAAEPVWISLQYRPIAKLNPAREHAVELVVDDETIERLVFRVGVGDPSDAVAAVAFTSGFDTLGRAIDPQTRFHVDTPQLTLRVRISNQVDPAGMLFSTLWYRDDTQIAQRAPDAPPGEPQATPTSDPRRFAFTFTPTSPLTPGNYRVALLLNGTEVRSIPFVMTDEAIPAATTPSDPAAEPTRIPLPSAPTATPVPSDAEVDDIVVASRIDFASQAPADGPFFTWEGDPETVVVLWLSVAVRDVQPSDTLEIVVMLDDEYYGSVTLTEASLESGWLAGRVELVTPSEGDSPLIYTFSAHINGVPTLDTTLAVSTES